MPVNQWIQFVQSEDETVFKHMLGRHETMPLGKYLQYLPAYKRWLACDNSGGNAWVEEFNHVESAVRYLCGEDEAVIRELDNA